MQYRAEIDGLRAIAVLAVLVFHFFPSTLNSGFNGFLGVDIFFVISGFLISKFIYKELDNNTFSFKDFYWRRIKRILPAAFFTLFFTTILAILLLTPYDSESYFKSLISAIFFVPNIYFWRSGGYFGDLDSLKPLLHYWSLGVEEQFYLFFPLTLFIFYKFFSKRYLLLLVGILGFSSLVLNIYLLNISGANPAFFLLPTRIWEFCIGCLAALLNSKYNHKASSLLSNSLIISLVLFLFFDTKNYVPQGFFVTILAGLFLFFRHPLTYFAKTLSSKIMTFIGKISFSLYLIHWPIIVFISYVFVDEIPFYFTLLSVFLVVLLSYISYRYVEVPFRYNLQNNFVGKFLSLAALLLFFTASVGINTDYLKINNTKLVTNLSNQVQTHYRCPINSYRPFGGSRACVLQGDFEPDKTEILLIGNSHAQMYAPAVKKNLNYKNILLMPLNECLPTISINVLSSCFPLAEENFDSLKELPSLKKVIFGMTWHDDVYFKNGSLASKQDLLIDVLKIVDEVESRNIDVYVISPLPLPNYNHASELSRRLKFKTINEDDYISSSKISFNEFIEDIKIFDEDLKDRLDDRYIDIYTDFCDESYCYHGDLNGSYYADSNHLSKYGLKLIEHRFKSLNREDN